MCNEKAVRETDFSHSLIRGEKRVRDEAEASGWSFLIHRIVYRLKCLRASDSLLLMDFQYR